MARNDAQDFREYLTKMLLKHPDYVDLMSKYGALIHFNCDGGSDVYYSVNSKGSYDPVSIWFKRRQIYINDSEWRMNPCIASVLDLISEFDIFSDFPVMVPDDESLGTIDDVMSGAREVNFKGKSLRVFEEIFDMPFYHATTESAWRSIQRDGLVPSYQVKDPQKTGLTTMNPQLQDAVYLTVSLKKAQDFAETIAIKRGESAVVLEIDPSAIGDYSDLIPDEDAFRYSYPSGGERDWGIEDFDADSPEDLLHSIQQLGTFGYRGVIPPEAIKLYEAVEK